MRHYITLVEALIETTVPRSEDGWLYHGTGKDNLPGIAQRGLVPTRPSDIWPEYDDYSSDLDGDEDDDEDQLPDEAFEPRTFFTVSPSMAMEYSQNNASGGVLLRVPDTCADFEEGETDWPYHYTTTVIAPQHIQVWTDAGWVPLSDQ